MSLKDHETRKRITKRLSGPIKLDDQKLIEEIVGSEDWLDEPCDLGEEAVYPNNRINNSECSMLDQEISRPKRKGDKAEGLTLDERRHLEESMKRQDNLMRRLSKM